MIDPALWESLPFNNLTALQDFWGGNALYHQVLAETVFRVTGTRYPKFPLGDGGGALWLRADSREHISAAAALGLVGPPALEGYDLRNPEDFASFMFLHAQDLRRLGRAAGIV